MSALYVRDTVLLVPDRVRDPDTKYAIHRPARTKERARLSDGIKYPVTVVKALSKPEERR